MPIELKSILQVNRQESLKKWLEIIKDQHASGLSALACCKGSVFLYQEACHGTRPSSKTANESSKFHCSAAELFDMRLSDDEKMSHQVGRSYTG